MPLQIRRGSASALSSITPAEGEPLYTTDTKRLYLGDGTTAGGVLVGPSAGGGGSDGTVPLITQAYAATEGYGLGSFQTHLVGTGYVLPVVAQTFGAFIDRAGSLEVGVTQTSGGGMLTPSGHTASLGGFTRISSTNYRCAASTQLARNTITAVVRLPSAPTGSSAYQAGVGFTDAADFFNFLYTSGTMGVVVYAGPSGSNWLVRYTGGDGSGYPLWADIDTGVAKNTAWRTIQIITETTAGVTTYTIKIGGATVHTITTTSLLSTYGIDMSYSYFYAPHVAVRSFGDSATAARIVVDHLSILSEVVR